MPITVSTATLIDECRDIADKLEDCGNWIDAGIIRGLCARAESLSSPPLARDVARFRKLAECT